MKAGWRPVGKSVATRRLSVVHIRPRFRAQHDVVPKHLGVGKHRAYGGELLVGFLCLTHTVPFVCISVKVETRPLVFNEDSAFFVGLTSHEGSQRVCRSAAYSGVFDLKGAEGFLTIGRLFPGEKTAPRSEYLWAKPEAGEMCGSGELGNRSKRAIGSCRLVVEREIGVAWWQRVGELRSPSRWGPATEIVF